MITQPELVYKNLHSGIWSGNLSISVSFDKIDPGKLPFPVRLNPSRVVYHFMCGKEKKAKLHIGIPASAFIPIHSRRLIAH